MYAVTPSPTASGAFILVYWWFVCHCGEFLSAFQTMPTETEQREPDRDVQTASIHPAWSATDRVGSVEGQNNESLYEFFHLLVVSSLMIS